MQGTDIQMLLSGDFSITAITKCRERFGCNRLNSSEGYDTDFAVSKGTGTSQAVAKDEAFCFLYEDNLKLLEELGYKTVLWSFAYADWDNNSQMAPEKAIEKIQSGTHNGEIILLHPTSKTNADILSKLIDDWKEMGFRFGTLDELS